MTTPLKAEIGREQPTAEISSAIEVLYDVPGYRKTGGLGWYADEQRWALHFTLQVPVPSEAIRVPDLPEITRWVALFAAEYPHGPIEIFPAADGGITDTFPHQEPNRAPAKGRPWRRGKLCVTTPFANFARPGYDTEPRAAATRLTWHLDRTRQWLDAARRGTLLDVGEPFELPVYAPPMSAPLLVFEASAADLGQWAGTTDGSGLASIVTPDWNPRLRVVTAFGGPRSPTQSSSLPKPHWGYALGEGMREGREEAAIWARLPGIPVVPPWRAPETWDELVTCLETQDVRLLDLLQPAAHGLRDGNPHLLLLGVPLPVHVGDTATVLHWLAIHLPVLSRNQKFRNGFRRDELGYWMRDRTEVLRPGMRLNWIATANWSPEEIATRGRAASALRRAQVVLIGAGALGSSLAELLIREGVVNLTVIDGDDVTGGNLVRHTLGLRDVGESKAAGLAARLNAVTPHARVGAVDSRFPGGVVGEAALRAADLVIDCTADDAIVSQLTGFAWSAPKLFASCFVGLNAKRLFIFTARGAGFPERDFAALLNPWISAEREEFRGAEMPWEATGCWHPVFPARAGDFALFAAAVVRRLEAFASRASDEAVLNVLEQQIDGDGILEIREVRLPPDQASA